MITTLLFTTSLLTLRASASASRAPECSSVCRDYCDSRESTVAETCSCNFGDGNGDQCACLCDTDPGSHSCTDFAGCVPIMRPSAFMQAILRYRQEVARGRR